MSWNKSFKAIATEKYDQCLAKEGINQLTSAGNYYKVDSESIGKNQPENN